MFHPTSASFLDHGLVRIRDVMGDDLTVVNAAKVSFDVVATEMTPKNKRLIRFLAEGGHWSPFAHPQISLELYIPGMVLDQLVKHRIGMVYSDEESFVAYENAADNQMSMRYKEPVDFYIPTEWREAPENKKQGSGDAVNNHLASSCENTLRQSVEQCRHLYQMTINAGIAPEQARLFLPYYAMYTRRYWTSSLMGIIRFLELREKEDAQHEIRQLARVVHQLVQPRFPESFAAYGLSTVDARTQSG